MPESPDSQDDDVSSSKTEGGDIFKVKRAPNKHSTGRLSLNQGMKNFHVSGMKAGSEFGLD